MTKTYGIKVTYALALYRGGLDELGVRGAYERACKLADLSQPERADFRRAVDESKP